jgi:branched-chain amino acid transport system permease protein
MVIGVIIGLPALRLSGLELALVTLMAAGAVATVLSLENFPNSNHGFFGYDISGPTTGSIPAPQYAGTTASFFRYCLVVAAILFVLVVIHVSMRPGRTWAAIRQSQASALAVGVNVTRYKLWAFALAAFVTGVGGALLAASPGGVTPGQFPAQDSITLLAVVLMAGAYNFWGAVLAGVLFQLLPALLTYWGVSSDLSLILFGVGALQVFTTAPGGLVGQTQAQARWLITKIRPAASARHAARLEPSADQARGGEDRDTGGQRSVAVPVPGARS